MSSVQPSFLTKQQSQKKRGGKNSEKVAKAKLSKQPQPDVAGASLTTAPCASTKTAAAKKRTAAWKHKRAIRQKTVKRINSLANALGTKLVFEDEQRMVADVKMKKVSRRRRPKKGAAPKIQTTQPQASGATTLVFASPTFVYNPQGSGYAPSANYNPFLQGS